SYVCYLLRQGYVCSLHSFPTRRSSDLSKARNSLENGSYPNDRFSIAAVARNNDSKRQGNCDTDCHRYKRKIDMFQKSADDHILRSEEHTSELQSREKLVCRLLLEKKKR